MRKEKKKDLFLFVRRKKFKRKMKSSLSQRITASESMRSILSISAATCTAESV